MLCASLRCLKIKKMTRNGEQYAYANNASQTAATAIAVLTIIVFQAPFRD